MDGDASGFTFPSSDYSKGQDATDISWADIFLDGIHSDDPGSAETGSAGAETSGLGASIHGAAHQTQQGVVGGQLQIHIPTHLQGTLASNAIQQANANLCGTVTYLAPAASTQQQVGSAGRIQNVVAVAGQHQVAAAGQQQMAVSVGHQQHQGNAKLVQIASSFPMASVQQLASSVPIQTILQPNQTLASQAIYGGQGAGLFPAQGSVHIENPKVVNVNFGPHVIGSDGSGQQAIIQTAEGKRVLITNSQLPHMSQSIGLGQPLVGTQLINSAAGSVIRANMATGTHTIMPASATGTQQIVLPSGSTVIPRQASAPQGGITKNVVLRPLNPNMSPVIYQSGQAGQLIHSQPTLITSSGAGLQVVNAGGNQGGQVQLIAQPSMNQTGIQQQQLNQSTIMNLLNSQGVMQNAGNQITGLVPGHNIFVNGQMLNIGQIGGLTVPQLQVQHNPQGGVTLSNINATVTRAAQFQPTAHQVVIQQNGPQQQQHVLLQPKSSQSSSFVTSTVSSQRPMSGFPGSKNTPAPTSNVNSASSTPVLTPTPSTPTPTPTPDLVSDSYDTGGKSNQGINILEQALAMSAIDLHSLEDDISFFDNSDYLPSVHTPPLSVTPVPPLPKPKANPAKSKPKASKSKTKANQPIVNVTVSNTSVPFHQPVAQLQNAQGQKVTLSPQQKMITANGQVYVLSANGQQFILQPSSTTTNLTSHLKPESVANATNVSNVSTSQLQIKNLNQSITDQSYFNSSVDGQLKLSPKNISMAPQQKNTPVSTNAQLDSKIFIKASPDGSGIFKIQTSLPAGQIVFTTMTTVNSSPSTISLTSPSSQTLAALNETQMLQAKNQKITTLSGTFLKQEPLESVIKREPVAETQSSVSQDVPNAALSAMNLTYTSLASTTSAVFAMATPLVVSSASFTTVTTTTTQSHQVTIMSTSQMAGSMQTSVSAAGSHQLYFSASDKTLGQPLQVQGTPALSHSVGPAASYATSTNLKSNSREKDPANIKSMIPVKEFREKSEELDVQQNIQPFPTIKNLDPPQQIHQIQSIQEPQLPGLQQQQMHSNHQSRSAALDNCVGSVQQFVIPQLGRCLAEQQLLRDRSLALSPDVNSPFKSLSDAMRRLVRYHTLQDHKPLEGSKTTKTWDARYSKLCDYLVKKKRCYMRRFSTMQLYHDMCPEKRPEHIQNLICYNEQLRELIESEKEKAKNHPDLFEPINPDYPAFNQSSPTEAETAATTDISFDDAENEKAVAIDVETPTSKLKYFGLKETYIDPGAGSENSDSPHASPSSLKRKLPDKGSTGTLKLVLKRRTTDNFVVKKSSAECSTLPQDFKPIVNLERSDSECEFDSQTSASCSQPMVVRRRTSSVLSQLTSSDTSSNNSSLSSHAGKAQGRSSLEEDLEEGRGDSNEDHEDEEEIQEYDVEEELEKSSSDEDDVNEQYANGKQCTQRGYVSFEGGAQNSAINNDDSCGVSEDAFMENDEILASKDAHQYDVDTINVSGHPCSYNDMHGAGIENIHSGKSSSHLMSDSAAATSCGVYNSGLLNPLFKPVSSKHQNALSSIHCNSKNIDHSVFSFDNTSSTFDQSCAASSSMQEEEYMCESAVSAIEKEAASKGLPSSSLFTTPNKSLLQTDAMFNSDEEDGVTSDRRVVSTFEIDNKDPQSSMINDSVRSAINSVLDGDDDDDMEDSQASWASAVHAASSSSSSSSHRRNLFHTPLSSSGLHRHDADLDAAVQSILNN